MRLIVTLEYRFSRTADGAVWTHTLFAHSFWKRYLSVFDHVRVVARVRDVPSVTADWKRADGPGVSFVALPYYLGPWQYLSRLRELRGIMRGVVRREDAVILRVGSPIAGMLHPVLRQDSRPYGLEVVGDPYDGFAPGAIKHPLRPFLRWWFPRQLREQCAGACAVSYVTARALQCRYPASTSAFSTHYSSIELHDSAFVSTPRPSRPLRGRPTLITIGSLEHHHKAPDVLIDAVGTCVREGLDLSLLVVGDGRHRPALEARARALGLKDRIQFLGELPAGEPVRTELDRSDLFVLPSRHEGLPRAVIEAMARGLPCIASTVGGIPELLPPEDLVPAADACALARKIREVLGSPERMARMSSANLAQACQYRDEILRSRRVAFYQELKERTEAWQRSAG
jgi:glycosyltransferase involved in cell wall biosynthesis